MPRRRLFGNNVLSFIEKACSCCWNIMDLINGYNAIHQLVLGKLDFWITGIPRTAGTIMVAALSLILGFEMLLQAIYIDISNVPKKRK